MAYEKSPALVAYLQRVGAEELSFKRFMVKEHKGNYYVERALIRIDDGKIKCSKKEYAPTEKEQADIEQALINAEFPKSVGARSVDGLKPMLASGDTYLIWDRATDLIVMVQQCVRLPSGAKSYPVWSFWNDGVWRKMEPDGKLPFWKPRVRSSAAKLMIHEGAKAAKYVQEEIADKGGASHPWGEDLSSYEHWGLLGGALAPHRSFYEEVRRENFIEVVYACDNDWPGQSALQEVSRHYGLAMKGLRPDAKFPEAWDMADPMPKELFSGTRWIGPTFEDMIVPATWATEVVPAKGGKGRPTTMLKNTFKEEWCHCVTPEVFVHRDWPNQMLTAKEFDNKVAPYSDTSQTSMFVKRDDASKGAIIKYSPAEKPGIYSSKDGGRFVNTYVPSQIKAERGDITPWLTFLEHLVPVEEDRKNLMRWCATLVARPEIKMLYGVLLISETQGVGKGTLGEKILSPLVGQNNTSSPSENEICDSNYNYWLAHRRLAVVHEIYAGHSARAYNRLKSVITDKYVSVSKKYMANYEIENWIHVFACSNSMRAIQLSSDDRRWFVPKVTDRKQSPRYWVDFFEWITNMGGLSIIKWWAEEFVRDPKNVVMRGEDAPWSTIKREVIEEGKSATERFVIDTLGELIHVTTSDDEPCEKKRAEWKKDGKFISSEIGIFTLDTEIQEVVKRRFYDNRYNEKLLRPPTIRRAAKETGMFCGNVRMRCPSTEWGLFTYDNRCYVLSTSQSLANKEHPSEMGQKPLTAQDIENMRVETKTGGSQKRIDNAGETM